MHHLSVVGKINLISCKEVKVSLSRIMLLNTSSSLNYALVHSGCYNRIPQNGWLKQQKLISEGWNIQDQRKCQRIQFLVRSIFLACGKLITQCPLHNRAREREIFVSFLFMIVILSRKPHPQNLTQT